MRLNRLTLHFAAVLLLTQAASVSAANINVVWTSEVGQFAPLWVTKEAKLFEKYGNNVQLIFIQGATSAAAALSIGRRPSRHVFAAGGDLDAGAGLGHVRPAGQYHGQSRLRTQGHQKHQGSKTGRHQPLRQQRRFRRPLSAPARRLAARTSTWRCCKSAINRTASPPSRPTTPMPRC